MNFYVGISLILILDIFILFDIFKSSFKNNIFNKIFLSFIIIISWLVFIVAKVIINAREIALINNIDIPNIYYIIFLLSSPIIYFILSLDIKTNLSKKDNKKFANFKLLSNVMFGLISTVISILTIKYTNQYGVLFLFIAGLSILGVIYFHILYPNYWENKKSYAK